jgi:FkbM family methyltransferase
MSLNSAIRRGLRKLGIERIHHPSFAGLMAHEAIETVFDVGANDGHFGSEIREQGYKGTIVSFEPIPSVFEKLKARSASDPKWHVFCQGVGDQEGHLPISVTAATVFSSFKAPSNYTARKFSGAQVDRTEMVPVGRLDRFLDQHPEFGANAYLKIDTQGFEKEVLAGAGEHLRRFKAIQLEVALRPLYDGQDTLVSMVTWMADQGFEIGLAKENGYDWSTMRLLEMDLLFVPRW